LLDEIYAKNLERVKKFSEEAESQLIQAEQKLFPQLSTPPVQLPPPEAKGTAPSDSGRLH
jgi:hypothetical protein